MDTARSLHDHQLVEAEELWNMPFVDRAGFICRGCTAPVFPASFERDVNKRRPYFTLGKASRHEAGCDVDGEEQLLHRAQRRRVGCSDGFPLPFPSRLVLSDGHTMEMRRDPAQLALAAAHASGGGAAVAQARALFHGHTIKTIRPACRTFIQFPHDRDTLPLAIPGMPGRTYGRVFHYLGCHTAVLLPLRRRLFYARLRWHAELVADDHYCELALEAGAPCTLRIDWSAWSAARRRSFLREVLSTRADVIETRAHGGLDVWLFFIGTQDAGNPSLFVADEERFICCLAAPAGLALPR